MRDPAWPGTDRVIGFDAREMWRDPEIDWDTSRRDRLLIDAGVTKPLSLDTMVWASVFNEVHGLWPDYAQMVQALDTFGVERPEPSWHIAVTVVMEPTVSSIWDLSNVVPQRRERFWPLIGYDVAATGFTSALTNCGYRAGETKPSPTGLNAHHLFADAMSAGSFRQYSDDRVPEHAPFFVFGLYRLP